VAYTSVELDAPPDDVFALLVDAHAYPRWLIGASRIRDVDDTWPAPGSRFHHRVGFGPFSLADSTKVLAIEPGRMLRLAVRARPLVSAIVTFRVVGDDHRSVLSFEEEPSPRVLGNLVRPVMDPLTHFRNHRSLRRLAALVQSTRPEPSAADRHGRERPGVGADTR
jgi:uncharacterized protein YndB with AHSA1/START domain